MSEPEEVIVLAVDDKEENLVALAALLKRPGLRLLQARSGNDALEALLVNDVGLALLDVNMPGMDGFELAELMRGSLRTRDVPIIFLTAAMPERARISQGYASGAVDFLTKPLDPYLLASKVEVFAQLYRQKRQIALQLEQVQQAQEMSDLFVGVLGHDLRNPLNNISLAADLLLDEEERVASKAQMIKRSTKRMGGLINQVLDFALARLKAGFPIKPVAADLGKIANQVTTELLGPIEIQREGLLTGEWDTDRMMQVLSNLLSNALEYRTPESPILLRLNGSDKDIVVVEVNNHGSMTEACQETLFSPFKPRSAHSKGLGLGLYIVDQITRAHGGTIRVKSNESSGTTFTVRLPRQAKTHTTISESK